MTVEDWVLVVAAVLCAPLMLGMAISQIVGSIKKLERIRREARGCIKKF